MKKGLGIIALSIMLITSSTAANEHEQRLQECEATLNHCDLVVQKQADLINFLIEQSDQDELLLAKTVDQLVEERAVNDSWYKNPFIMSGLGIIAGALLHKELSQ